MMEKVIALWAQESKNEAAYNAAEAANDQAGMEAARAKHQEFCQTARENGKDFCFVLRLYNTMMERGNKLLDLDDVHEADVPEVAAILKKFGIKSFTFSSTWSSAVGACFAFTQHGYSPAGMTQINGMERIFGKDGSREQLAAFIFTAND